MATREGQLASDGLAAVRVCQQQVTRQVCVSSKFAGLRQFALQLDRGALHAVCSACQSAPFRRDP
eukprot:534472-Pyramimonas_sp.AAC.1